MSEKVWKFGIPVYKKKDSEVLAIDKYILKSWYIFGSEGCWEFSKQPQCAAA